MRSLKGTGTYGLFGAANTARIALSTAGPDGADKAFRRVGGERSEGFDVARAWPGSEGGSVSDGHPIAPRPFAGSGRRSRLGHGAEGNVRLTVPQCLWLSSASETLERTATVYEDQSATPAEAIRGARWDEAATEKRAKWLHKVVVKIWPHAGEFVFS